MICSLKHGVGRSISDLPCFFFRMPLPEKRSQLIAGNWKMYKTLAESRVLAEDIVSRAGPLLDARGGALRIGLFPTSLSLAEVAGVVSQASSSDGRYLVGAQNMHFETQGAFTGEISAEMIKSVGGNAVILGHSERRHIFGETDELVGKKVAKALEAGLTPILCVGETIEERDAGETMKVVERQLAAGLELVADGEVLSSVVIAYEPVWAIGTGRTASPQQAQEVHRFVREELAKMFGERGIGEETSEMSLILYGGSVKPENAGALLSESDIDGALVGGASLKPESFLGICEASLPGAERTGNFDRST